MTQKISKQIQRNILLNPGPATTTTAVKEALIQPDICPREQEVGVLFSNINQKLLSLVNADQSYESILLPCSGTGAIEACLSSCVEQTKNQSILILINGDYGERMAEICQALGISYYTLRFDFNKPINIKELDEYLIQYKNTHNIKIAAFVHHETTTGLLNNLSEINQILKKHELISIVDAMSSFAGIPIDLQQDNVDYLISSSNKCLHAIAGIGIVIVHKNELTRLSKINSKNYYFNLYKNYNSQKEKGQFLFTVSIQILTSLNTALDELIAMGGVESRYLQYQTLYEILFNGMKNLGFEPLINKQYHSKILTSFKSPDFNNYSFDAMHDFLYKKGVTIYPGKSVYPNSFRVANMGDLDKNDICYFLSLLDDYISSC